MNDYYDIYLKDTRLKELQVSDGFVFIQADLADEKRLKEVFEQYRPKIVINLGAQAGVRYSIENPKAYMDSNMIGFFNVLEMCRHYLVGHLLYASSSSVYGNQEKTPFSTEDNVDHLVSLYAAMKKSNELMAHTYSHLYGMPTTGLRFFTVYGSLGRPDMAYFGFTNKIVKGESTKIFNNGDMYRDFTYIDDIVQGIENMLLSPPKGEVPYRVYNIGNNQPVKLMYFIETLEKSLGIEGKKEFADAAG